MTDLQTLLLINESSSFEDLRYRAACELAEYQRRMYSVPLIKSNLEKSTEKEKE